MLEKVQENGRVELRVLGGGVQVGMKVRREVGEASFGAPDMGGWLQVV